MTYQEAVEYLYAATPAFQQVGASAYKPGLDTIIQLDSHYDHPHQSYRTLHVAGTNGKGSTSHSLASILQASGYRVGLFTSPHLIDFRERVRVDGIPIDESFVCLFVDEVRPLVEELHPSFFELTTMMAFVYFRHCQVDYAIIEVGMGGRLDSTNIITPDLSIITGISKDHTQYLGDTLSKIASEKAGIIKPDVSTIIGRADEAEVREVFYRRTKEVGAPLIWAQEEITFSSVRSSQGGQVFSLDHGRDTFPKELFFGLGGIVQRYNLPTILTAVTLLRQQGVAISDESLEAGLRDVVRATGLRGRWEILSKDPLLICDTGHNEDGIRYVVDQLLSLGRPLHIVFGMVNDKDISGVLALLPREATYYFTAASVPRALAAEHLRTLAQPFRLEGTAYPDLPTALEEAKRQAKPGDAIFVGGSNFLIADLLQYINS